MITFDLGAARGVEIEKRAANDEQQGARTVLTTTTSGSFLREFSPLWVSVRPPNSSAERARCAHRKGSNKPVPPENSIRLEARFERTSVAVDGVAISRKVALRERAAGLFEPFW